MATNTTNFKFKKPDESDFYSVQDQNGNWDLADGELQKLNAPTFEDYTTGTPVPSAATALEALKSKIKLPVWMSNVVAFCKGCCTLAMIVNNCVSSDADKPLAAAQGKVLQDQLTKLNSDFGGITIAPMSTYFPLESGADNSKSILEKMPPNSMGYFSLWGDNNRMGLSNVTGIVSYIFYREKDLHGSIIAATKVGIKTRIYENGILGEWVSAATKSDLASLSIQQFTWRGEATRHIDVSVVIDGYKPIAITGVDPTGLDSTSSLRYFRFNKDTKRAIASFSASTVTACTFDVLCIRI